MQIIVKESTFTFMEKAKVAGKAPQMENLESGKTYAWCACGKSEISPGAMELTKVERFHRMFLKRKRRK